MPEFVDSKKREMVHQFDPVVLVLLLADAPNLLLCFVFRPGFAMQYTLCPYLGGRQGCVCLTLTAFLLLCAYICLCYTSVSSSVCHELVQNL